MVDSTLISNMTLDQALQEVVLSYPDREALVFETDRLTYRELGRRVSALADGLHRLGLCKGEKIAVILPNCAEFVYSFFAIGQIGGIMVPIDPLYRRREIQHVLSDSEAAAAIFVPDARGNNLLDVMRALEDQLAHLRHLIVASKRAPKGMRSLDSVMVFDAPPVATRSESDDLFGLMYTSGTTGLPKAVMHTHRSMLAPMLAAQRQADAMVDRSVLSVFRTVGRILARYGTRFFRWARKQQTTLTPMPFHALAGYGSMVSSLTQGSRLVVPERFHPMRILELVERERVNILVGTPSMYRLLLEVTDFERYDKSSLLYCVIGTALCPPDLAREVRARFGCPIMIPFGATETGGGVSTTTPLDSDRLQTETIGRPLPGVQVKIVDEQRREVSGGQVGELACRLPGVMKGYYKEPETTAQALDAAGWYYTGDLAVMDEDGYLRIVGRKKDLIIRGGQNVYPAEIEHYLLTHPDLEDAAVVGVPSQREGETVWAYVVPKAGANLTSTQILDYCRGEITAYKVPSEVRIVDTLPRTPTQKVRKFELRQQALQEVGEAAELAPRPGRAATG